MKEPQEEDKMLPASWQRPPSLAFVLACLLILTGAVSFIYSDGFGFVKTTLVNLIKPSFSLDLDYDNNYLPADGSLSTTINVVAKNKKDQLITGENIGLNIVKGSVDISITPTPPANVSKQVIVTATGTPGQAILNFSIQNTSKEIVLDIFDPAPPAQPVLLSPENDATFPTSTPIFSGQSPVGTSVEIYIDDQLNTITPTDESGLFSLPLDKSINSGLHKITTRSFNKYEIYSSYTSPIYISIQTSDPEIDIENIRIKPNPASKNDVFYMFIPVSADATEVKVLLEDHEWKLEDKNQSSIFSGAIRAPSTPGLYRLSVIVTNRGGDSILAENITSLTVE